MCLAPRRDIQLLRPDGMPLFAALSEEEEGTRLHLEIMRMLQRAQEVELEQLWAERERRRLLRQRFNTLLTALIIMALCCMAAALFVFAPGGSAASPGQHQWFSLTVSLPD